ncbi:hypothetical protein WD_0075 [Wolbachia endosymbiont of Drosophila melanogaster]|nr:hypothetical protein WD_0075 [Wolbachia endosymbiont of Drosophila melanogaster]
MGQILLTLAMQLACNIKLNWRSNNSECFIV